MEFKYYKSCDRLSIYAFHKVLSTNNLRYLIIGQDEYADDFEDLAIDENLASEYWASIYDEYCKLSEDNKSLMYFGLCSELLYLETRFKMASMLLGQLIKRLDAGQEVIELYLVELDGWNYKIKRDKPIAEEINRMFTQLKQSQNKIRLKTDEVEGYKPSDDDEPMSLMQQVLRLEVAIPKERIDPKETSVERWVGMIQNLKESNESKAKNVRK